MFRSASKQVVFWGCPLDCDEKHDAIQEKLADEYADVMCDDPLKPIVGMLAAEISSDQWRQEPSIPVPGWLRPAPPPEERAQVTTDDYIRFTDQNGCREYASAVQTVVSEQILPDFPCLIAVDHALSGGVYTALAHHYGPENLTFLILDSHTDVMPMSRLARAILYDAETNPASVYDRADPYLHNRTESYNASSFLHHLIVDGMLNPRNLFILGISDYPEKKVFRIPDPRIVEYVGAYKQLKEQGATLVTKKECQMQSAKVKHLLKNIRTPYIYVSIDMDIGARNAVEGVRFKNWQGLAAAQIYRLASIVGETGGSGLELVGLDITEINPRIAGRQLEATVDQTYTVAARLIRQMAFDLAG